MKFYVVRQDDEVSSDLCRGIEEIANSYGGLEFPLSYENHLYTEDDVKEYFVKQKQDSYYTNLFHKNCRCHLVPISSESSVLMEEEWDEVDEEYMLSGASSYLGDLEMQDEFDLDEDMYDMYSSFYD